MIPFNFILKHRFELFWHQYDQTSRRLVFVNVDFVRNVLLTRLNNKFGSFAKDNLIHIHTLLEHVPKTNAFQLFHILYGVIGYHLYRVQYSKSNLVKLIH